MRFSLSNQFSYELRSSLSGYPDFVFSGKIRRLIGHIPVFVYHTIEPVSFEQDLKYLADNNYNTLGIDEFVNNLTNRESRPENSIVLTFDDARSSFWRFAYPLLQRYRMKGVLFVIAGLTVDAQVVRENLSSVWSGRKTMAEINALDPNDTTQCTWPELKMMYESGWVDIESHSLFHKEVFIDTKIIDFLGPDSNYVTFQTPATAYLSLQDVGRNIVPSNYYGFPLFRAAPLHAGLQGCEMPLDLMELARDLWMKVAETAPNSKARRTLLRTRWEQLNLRRYLRKQTESEVERNIVEDITISRDVIKNKVGTGTANHFCLPFTVGSETTVRLLRKHGIRSCSWGVMPGKQYNTPGDDIMTICRIKSDFLWRLPGGDRRSLAQVYAQKVVRRIKGGQIF